MSRWFRHYAGMMRDEKLVRAAIRSKQTVERVVWIWGAILESAAEINDNGRYEFDAGEAAYFLRCDVADMDCVITSLEDIGRLAKGVVARWSDRQFDSDVSRERQRRYRERKANSGLSKRNNNNRNSESDVTRPSPDGAVTPQETDTETDKEDANASSKRERDAQFAELYAIYPRKVSKAGARKRFDGALKLADFQTILAGVKRYAAERAGEDQQFTMHPDRWLYGQHWADEPAPPRLPMQRATPPPKKLTQGESLRNMAREAGVIDDTSTSNRRVETGVRDGENPGVGNLIRLAVAGNHGWGSR